MEVFIPFLVLLWASVLPHLQLPSAEAWGQISLKNYREIFDFVDALPFINTAILMVAVPTRDDASQRAGFLGRGSHAR